MNSLRARMILGFAVAALLPVAVLVGLMAGRIRAGVRAQGDERLASALGVLHAQLEAQRAELGDRLALLAADPELKRRVLVPSGGADLRDLIATQQFLLGLDYLGVTDPAGGFVADGVASSRARLTPGREPLGLDALPARDSSGAALLAIAGRRAVALDAAAEISYQDAAAGWVRGGLLLDSLRLAGLRATSGVELLMLDGAGDRMAGTLAAAPAGLPAAGAPAARCRQGGRGWLARADALTPAQGGALRLVALVPTDGADATVAALQRAALLLGLAAVAGAIALGWLWSRQISRPVEQLAAFSKRIAHGEWDEPLALRSVREVQTLVDALERMRGDLRGYRERLVASERQAAYGEMARKVAHEIKNPLTPIAVSVADLKRSYEQQRPDFGGILASAVRTIDEEVLALKRMLREFSEFGRLPEPRFASCDAAALLADLATLHRTETGAGRLAVEAAPGAGTLAADRDQLRQALLNLLQNALDATADAAGHVWLTADGDADAVRFVVRDDGPGLDAAQRERLFVPGFTTKAHGSGLGLAIVERTVTEHGGTIRAESEPGRGTTFTLRIPRTRGA